MRANYGLFRAQQTTHVYLGQLDGILAALGLSRTGTLRQVWIAAATSWQAQPSQSAYSSIQATCKGFLRVRLFIRGGQVRCGGGGRRLVGSHT